jgi:hypothetical protein
MTSTNVHPADQLARVRAEIKPWKNAKVSCAKSCCPAAADWKATSMLPRLSASRGPG